MSWLWQPLLPGAAQLLSAPVTNYTLDVDLGTYTITGQALELVAAAVLPVDTGAYVIAGQSPELEATKVAATAPVGPADDRPARRRRDRTVAEAYWAARQREANEEAERKRLAALEEAEEALREAERAKKVDAKRAAVRRVFQALKRAATSEHAERSAQAAEQVALDAVKAKATSDQREAYLVALDQLNAEMEAISLEVQRLYARRREEEQFLLQRWFAA